MLTKEAKEKLATEIDKGFIMKCAEYGFDWNEAKDRAIVLDLMKFGLDQINQGSIEI